MSIRFEYDSAREILFARAEGLITFEEIKDHIEREAQADALGYREIFDARKATTNLTASQAKELVSILIARMKAGPVGPTAVVTPDDVVFGMARMLEILLEIEGGPAFAAFRTCEAAADWLMRGAPVR